MMRELFGVRWQAKRRHRFGFGQHVIVRKRRRRCALPAHSKACGASACTSVSARKMFPSRPSRSDGLNRL